MKINKHVFHLSSYEAIRLRTATTSGVAEEGSTMYFNGPRQGNVCWERPFEIVTAFIGCSFFTNITTQALCSLDLDVFGLV